MPAVDVFGVHPGSLLLILFYFLGVRLIAHASKNPMWRSQKTPETVEDTPDQNTMRRKSIRAVLIKFLIMAAIVSVAGYAIAKSGIIISESTQLSESFVGSLLTAVATSLPELIVSLTAIRNNALTLAVGNIIGGNTFDVITVGVIDIFYRDGSALHSTDSPQFLLALTSLMTAIVVMGMIHRQKYGFGRIGWEGVMIIILFVSGYAYLYMQ